ncbi:unnamed protein product [Citrullus colocynthis]|uniref:Uncharacterized protein n=1 Tax=Citrullus colocynthis TaxID=252529 RepID=A0ABP0ZF95_9ROSI
MKLKLGSGNSPDLAEYDCKYHSQKIVHVWQSLPIAAMGVNSSSPMLLWPFTWRVSIYTFVNKHAGKGLLNLKNSHGIQMSVLIVLVDSSDVVTYEIDLSVQTTTVITYRSSIFYSPPIHFLPSAAARPKRTHFGEACNETTPGASSASTSIAFPPFRRRISQPPPPPPRWFARGPNCISQPKTPSEAGNRICRN